LVGRGRSERLCIAHVCEVTRQPDQIYDLVPRRRILAALDAEAQHAAECAFLLSVLRANWCEGCDLRPTKDRRPFHVARGIVRERERYQRCAARAAIASPGLAKEEHPKGVEKRLRP
jgi:hypothetical protein